ncbi:hypothetical protein DFP72DRAFT_850419 [Ephemerocybe angulata]|uniref:Uncharacterized protein n=1 Tax=Ephemerocybe angulata TaxID=980116 RepID=A0A8H6HSK8_9AGAR|nr:hypothetical protein DFP72DRAFT_850419 [Tulosesus angulatus]
MRLGPLKHLLIFFCSVIPARHVLVMSTVHPVVRSQAMAQNAFKRQINGTGPCSTSDECITVVSALQCVESPTRGFDHAEQRCSTTASACPAVCTKAMGAYWNACLNCWFKDRPNADTLRDIENFRDSYYTTCAGYDVPQISITGALLAGPCTATRLTTTMTVTATVTITTALPASSGATVSSASHTGSSNGAIRGTRDRFWALVTYTILSLATLFYQNSI